MIVRTSGRAVYVTYYVVLLQLYCNLLDQLLLTAYQQPGRDVSGSHNGQIGAQTSPLDSPMRLTERFRRSSRSPAFFAKRVRRVSAVDRRAAAAYDDANML